MFTYIERMGFRSKTGSSDKKVTRSTRFPRRRPGGQSPEQINHRYHLIRVTVTLVTMGSITAVIGLAALIDPENLHPLRYMAGCLVVVAITGGLLLYVGLRRPRSTMTVEIVMLTGLSVTFANTIYGGLLDVDPWWQVCSYLVVIMIAGGVSLRQWNTFVIYIAGALVSWVIVIENSGEGGNFIFDSYVLMLLGAVVAGAILLMFKSERKRVTSLNQELLTAASHDQLTGILNRNGLLQAANALKWGRRGTDGTWCAYIDVDYFKTINDRFGHDLGDEVLESVAAALSGDDAPGTLTARWGGDEFVVVGYGDAPSEDELEALVNAEIRKVESSAAVSVGISRRGADESVDLAGMLKRADQRMYRRRAEVRQDTPLLRAKSA